MSSDSSCIQNLLDYFEASPRAFTLTEWCSWLDEECDGPSKEDALRRDNRFVHFNSISIRRGERYIPETTLLRWWCCFSLRLARLKQCRLSWKQLANAMSSLRPEGSWDTPPEPAIEFGQRLGFVALSWTPGYFVFPMAYLCQTLSSLVSWTVDDLVQISEHGSTSCTLDDRVDQILGSLTHRESDILKARLSLSPYAKRETLEEIAKAYGCTRERIRQIEAKALRKLRHPTRSKAIARAFLREFMRRQSTLVWDAETDKPICDLFKALCGMSYAIMPDKKLLILGIPRCDLSLLSGLDFLECSIDSDLIAKHLGTTYLDILSSKDLSQVIGVLVPLMHETLTKTDKVYLALRSVGEPAHYSEVAEVYNYLNSDDPMSVRSVHAVLSRCSYPVDRRYGIVWIGKRGTYALQEWGHDRPSLSIHDTVAKIVSEKYEATGQKPVPFAIIQAEVGRYRSTVNNSSLIFATHCNPRVTRLGEGFAPIYADDATTEEADIDQLHEILMKFQQDLGKDA